MAAAEPDSSVNYDTDSDSEYDSDDEYDYGDDPDEYKKTRYYLKHRQEYNYGSNHGVNVMSYPGGRFDVSRFGDEERGITAVGPVIEAKIQELLGKKTLRDYHITLHNLAYQPNRYDLHEKLRLILSRVLSHRPQGRIPPHFNNYLAKIIKDENERYEHAENEYFMVDPENPRRKAAIKIQSVARTLGPKRKRRIDVKTRKQVAKVMLKGQEDANTGIVGAKHVRDNVSSFLTGRARGTKKKRRRRRKKSKKNRKKKRTKRKGRGGRSKN